MGAQDVSSARKGSWRASRTAALSLVPAGIIVTVIVVAVSLQILVPVGGAGNECTGGLQAFGTAGEARSGASYDYNFSIESASACFTWNDVHVEITNNGGTVVSSGITSYTVYNGSSTQVCYSSGPTETEWTAGTAGSGASLITGTQTLVVLATVYLVNTGAQLNVLRVVSYAGTNHASIP